MPERSALVGAKAGLPARWAGEGLALEERPSQGAVSLRLNGAAERDLAAAFLNMDLSGAPGAVAERAERAVLRLGPDEWLVLCPRAQEPGLVAGLRKELEGHSGAAAPIGNGTVLLDITGPQGRALLAKGSAIDLHPAAFAPGRCAVTGFGRDSRGGLAARTRSLCAPGRPQLRRSFWDWAVDLLGSGRASAGRRNSRRPAARTAARREARRRRTPPTGQR